MREPEIPRADEDRHSLRRNGVMLGRCDIGIDISIVLIGATISAPVFRPCSCIHGIEGIASDVVSYKWRRTCARSDMGRIEISIADKARIFFHPAAQLCT